MIALKLQQLQYNVKKNGRGVFPMLFGPSDVSPPGAAGLWGINGRYRSTECPRHRQFQPLVHRFVLSNACVPFLVGVLHYSYVR